MKEWYLGREPRERAILAAGAVITAILVFWAFVWTPLQEGSAELGDSLAQKHQLLVDVQRASALAPSPGERPANAAPQSLMLLIDGTAQSHGLAGKLTRTLQQGADGISITFRDAAFDALVGWLITLQSTHALRVESATVNGTRVPGLVNGQLILRRQ